MPTLKLNSKYAYGISLMQGAALLVLGVACALLPILVTIVIAGIILFTVYAFLKERKDWIWYGIAASPFFEVWSRMSRAPVVPDEIGKYYLLMAIAFVVLLNLSKGAYSAVHIIGRVVVLLLVPSLLVAFTVFNLDQWIFNALGILELGILVSLASRERWDVERFCKTMQYGVLPIILILAYLTVKTPSYDDIEFKLAASTTASGGFGSNQVSTILGLGIVFMVLLIILKRPLFSSRPVNYILIGVLLFRGLLTFSRGGMVAAVIAIFIAMVPIILASSKAFARYSMMSLGIIILGAIIFIQANNLTGNMLLLRYEGETKGTLSGTKEKTLNKITSGRVNVLIADYMIFLDNPIFGVGPGIAKLERTKYAKVHSTTAAHTEFSRLLSEHGLGGLLISLIMIMFPAYWVYRQRLKMWRGICAALFTISVLTSTHAAMRTNTTTVCFALATIPMMMPRLNEKPSTPSPKQNDE